MKSFAYEAIDANGQVVSGTVRAGSREAATNEVRNLGQTPTQVARIPREASH